MLFSRSFLLVGVAVSVLFGATSGRVASKAGSHPSCVDGRFRCWNFQTIPCQWTCDGHTDCQPLGEDEADCDATPLVVPVGEKYRMSQDTVIRNQ